MKKFFEKFFPKDNEDDTSGLEDEYVELDSTAKSDSDTKVVVRPFTIDDFSDVKDIIESIRTGNTIALINIKPLKEKDMIELKRAINKLKKTCDATHGQIAGFGEDYIIVAPDFAEIYRPSSVQSDEE